MISLYVVLAKGKSNSNLLNVHFCKTNAQIFLPSSNTSSTSCVVALRVGGTPINNHNRIVKNSLCIFTLFWSSYCYNNFKSHLLVLDRFEFSYFFKYSSSYFVFMFSLSIFKKFIIE